MSSLKQEKLADIIFNNFSLVNFFLKKNIDFYCSGNDTLLEACQKNNLDINKVINELQVILDADKSTNQDFKHWSLAKLADYIVATHHAYIANKSHIIIAHLQKLTSQYAQQQPELVEVTDLFQGCANALANHTRKEEMILFPFIKQIAYAKEQHMALPHPPFGTVNNPINMMMHEHDDEIERMQQIVKLTNNYALSINDSDLYKKAFSLLQEFEQDLYIHIFLENNLLFPKASLLEAEVTQG